MNKKEVTEIKRRIKKEGCTFTQIAGCYVDGNKNKVVSFSEPFWDVEEEEKHKYVEIANKVLSGKLNNNLVELAYTTEEEINGDSHKLLMGLRESKLKDEGLLDAFYDHVIDTYNFGENYFIVLFHDVYDVPVKTKDNMKLDDSEETYEYIMCAICPVALSKAGLGYNSDAQNISMVKRNWVVGPVNSGFTFPAFTERSTDVHAILAYTKDAKAPHHEFWEKGLGVIDSLTSTEKRNAFNNMVKKSFEPGEEADGAVISVQGGLSGMVEKARQTTPADEPVFLESSQVEEVLTDSGIEEEKAKEISKKYEEFFNADVPDAEELIDEKALRESQIRSERKKLMNEISELSLQNERLMESTDPVAYGDSTNPKVILRVSEEKAEEIRTKDFDGTKCLVIPLSEMEETIINGKSVKFS